MASSSLSDSSTCAERTLNVTGLQRNALIKLWEQRAMGGGIYRKRLSMQRSLPDMHLVYVYVMSHTYIAPFPVHCTALHASTHTQHPTQPAGGPDQTSQHSWCIPVLTRQFGTTVAGIYHIYKDSAEIGPSMSRSSFISPQGTNTNLLNKGPVLNADFLMQLLQRRLVSLSEVRR